MTGSKLHVVRCNSRKTSEVQREIIDIFRRGRTVAEH